jgi:hypothetical protein
MLGPRRAHPRPVRALSVLLVLCSAAFAAKEPARDFTTIPDVRGNAVLWNNPGPVERLDLRYGSGGIALVPRPPFAFVKEDTSGSTPKVQLRDSAGRQWAVKFGVESRPDTFGSRMAWALGYFTEINYFVPEGIVSGARELKRARKYIDESGRFSAARFQLRAHSPEYLAGAS